MESPNRPMSPRALFSSDMLESPAKSPTRSQPGTTVSTTTDFRITLPKLDEVGILTDFVTVHSLSDLNLKSAYHLLVTKSYTRLRIWDKFWYVTK